MRKSQIKLKLNQDLYYTIKIHATKMDIIDKNINTNKEKNNKFGDKKDFRLLNTQSYANTVKLTHI